MSNHKGYGTLTADGTTDVVVASHTVTFTAEYDSGTTPGTIAWEYKGPDGVWRKLYVNGTTAVEGSNTHMWTLTLGDDVQVRGNLSGSTSPQWDWQILSNPRNRD